MSSQHSQDVFWDSMLTIKGAPADHDTQTCYRSNLILILLEKHLESRKNKKVGL